RRPPSPPCRAAWSAPACSTTANACKTSCPPPSAFTNQREKRRRGLAERREKTRNLSHVERLSRRRRPHRRASLSIVSKSRSHVRARFLAGAVATPSSNPASASPGGMYQDRKSTRLNSSHVKISY